MPSPLHVVVLAHPRSEKALALAQRLLESLYGPPTTLELRVPTFLGPTTPADTPAPLDGLWQSGGEAVLLVYLLDARMARRVDGGTGEAWSHHLADALAQASADPRHRSVLPLALDRGGFDVLPTGLPRSVRELPAAGPLDAALQHVAVRALCLLSDRAPPPDEGRLQAPIQVFLSHAKRDLRPLVATDPVKAIAAALDDHAVDRFFDSSRIAPGEDFAVRIEQEVRSSDVLLVVWTDSWSDRPWCRRELLAAKQAGRAVVVVDALDLATVRAFPYIGNATWVRWRGAIPSEATHAPTPEELDGMQRERTRVLTRVFLAALRSSYERLALGEPADATTLHLGSAPEALDVAASPLVTAFVYPDPPVPDEERRILESLSRHTLSTPLSLVARAGLASRHRSVVVSVSSPGKEALAELGLSQWHIDTVTDEVHLGVLLAGLRIVYGGLLNYTSAGPSNFVQRLFDLVQRHGELAQQVGMPWQAPVTNCPPWPLHLAYGERELNLFGAAATFERGPQPELDGLAYVPWPPGEFPVVDSVERLLAVGLGLRAMREATTREGTGDAAVGRARPRILLGGTLAGSMGWLPGVVEEALCSLRARAPLFVLGGFGGAARAVGELLEGAATPSAMTDEAARAVVSIRLDGAATTTIERGGKAVAVYDEVRTLAQRLGLPFDTRGEAAEEMRALGAAGLEAALGNGLTLEENRELLKVRDGRRVLELVVRGLAAAPGG